METMEDFKINLESRIRAAKITNEIWEDEKSEARIKVLSEVLEDFNRLYLTLNGGKKNG